MNTINIDHEGRIYINDSPIEKLKDINITSSLLIKKGVHVEKTSESTIIICDLSKLYNEPFAARISFRNNPPKLSLLWKNGNCEKKGWGTSLEEMIDDKNTLTRIIEQGIDIPAEKYNEATNIIITKQRTIFISFNEKSVITQLETLL